jgi:redox-sensing transcriptional repressor
LALRRLPTAGAGRRKEARMAGTQPVPDIVIGRLPIYLRALTHLLEEGLTITSSQQLGQRLGISSAQIRKDLAHFGEFGKQGLGYEIAHLREALRSILRVDRTWDMAVVGAGDLGRAIAQYGGFEGRGFRVACVFDSDPAIIGRRLGGFQIEDVAVLPERVQALGIKAAIIAVPAAAAQAVVDGLVRAGVQAILNYAPITVTAPPHVRVQYIDPLVHLQRMTYYLGDG